MHSKTLILEGSKQSPDVTPDVTPLMDRSCRARLKVHNARRRKRSVAGGLQDDDGELNSSMSARRTGPVITVQVDELKEDQMLHCKPTAMTKLFIRYLFLFSGS